MESGRSQAGSVRRHVPRRSAMGPLTAADDPLADPPLSESPSTASTHLLEPASRASIEFGALETPLPTVDLRFLQDREQYYKIPTTDINEAFLKSDKQPSLETPLVTLLEHGHFRRAAETALEDLLKSQPNEARRIFELLYTRLACLILITRVDIASHEATPLIEFLAHGHSDIVDILPLIPWELRLLLVRHQSIAAADAGRRGMMSLYSLASEVRQHIKAAREAGLSEELKLWSERLRDLGLRVADALVEMGELETAARHLDSLEDADKSAVSYRKSLIRLRLGDLFGAKTCINAIDNERQKSSLEAVLAATNGDFDQAVQKWQQQVNGNAGDALSSSNLAVGLLYIGRIAEASDVLESSARRMPAFPGSLFNLATVYELCSEQAREKKLELAQKTAQKDAVVDTGGWERANFEFKL